MIFLTVSLILLLQVEFSLSFFIFNFPFLTDTGSYVGSDFQRVNSFSTFNPSEGSKQIEYFFASDAR